MRDGRALHSEFEENSALDSSRTSFSGKSVAT